jgi:predicted amidohydrolase
VTEPVNAAVAQFEARDGSKHYNLDVIEDLSARAARQGAHLVLFHELSVTGYTFLENLTREQTVELSEPVPGGDSLNRLQTLARSLGILISAGVVERDGDDLYNCQVVMSGEGLHAKHRKIHEFVSPHLACGDRHTVFDALGLRFGMLTCYDNNLPENARVTAMMGAQVILAPHVTGCLPSPAPGRGVVAPEVWANRHTDPVPCRMEFDGPKGRGWIMKWLPARAWENGVYVLYANPLGLDGGTIKPGGSMIIDPYGEVVTECRTLHDEVVCATLVPKNFELASGASYIRARRPELYQQMVEPNPHLAADKRPEVYWQKIRKQESK